MKKLLSFLLAMLIFVSPIIDTSAAAANISKEDLTVTAEERTSIESHMRTRGIWGISFVADVLFDENDDAKFLLGATDNGYIILERGTYVFHECSEGSNPYANFMSAKKYYGGPFCYYADTANTNAVTNSLTSNTEPTGIYNIMSGTYESSMNTMEFRADVAAAENSATSRSVTTNGETRVNSASAYIRRKAFGVNAGAYNNTCSAVATAIALNYITLQHNIPLVATNKRAESLDNGIPNSSNISTKYPKAHALHTLIVDTYGMHGVSYGLDLVAAVQRYAAYEVPSGHSLNLSHTLAPSFNTIKTKINADMPVLVGTTTASPSVLSGHTMVAYGYRGTNELLVHLGWYSQTGMTCMSSDGRFHNEFWMSNGYSTYGYYFTVS